MTARMTPNPNPSPELREALATIASALGDFDAAKIDSITVTRRIGNALHMAGAKWHNAQRRYGFDVDATIAADRFPFPMTAFYDTAFKDGRDDDYNPDAAIGRHLATPATLTPQTLPAPGEVELREAMWRAFVLVDYFAGEGLIYHCEDGSQLAADTVAQEVCAAVGIDLEDGWARTAASLATVAAANDEAVAKALEQQMEAQDEDLPSSTARERGLVWLEGWFDLRAALATSRSQHEGADNG